MSAAAVWYQPTPGPARRVGDLMADGAGRISFRYDPEWLQSGFAISRSLPLQGPPVSDTAGHNFFANLLPEAEARQRVARRHGLSPDNDFGLLRAIGGDCAGALSITDGEEPTADAVYEPITESALIAELATETGGRNAAFDQARLSLAGAQHKVPVFQSESGELHVPVDAAPSSHIAKAAPERFVHVPAYETFAALLAQRVELPVADIALFRARPRNYTLTRRYDRASGNRQLVRLHQEDFCQALGLPPSRKYEADGGPSIAECVALVRTASVEPARDLLLLLRWQAFNIGIGNADGHAKNLSLLRDGEGSWRLAPFYDLVSTRALPGLSARLAMQVGGAVRIDQIGANDWNDLARAIRMRPRYVVRTVGRVMDQIEAELEPATEEFVAKYGDYPALQQLRSAVEKQIRSTRRGIGI